MNIGLSAALVLGLHLFGVTSPDQEPAAPVEPSPDAPAPAPLESSPPTLTVRVVYVSPEGAVIPASNEELTLERWSTPPGPMGGEPQLAETWVGRTDARGRAAYRGAEPSGGQTLEASVVRNGISFRSGPLEQLQPGVPLEVRLYDITDDQDGLTASYQVDLSVRDGFLIVEGSLYVDNSSRVVVVPSPGQPGLRFPAPLPAAFGQALDLGLLPPETAGRHMSVRAMPERGRMLFRDGALWYDGPVLPGVRQTLQMRYALPITDERMDIAFRSDVPLTALTISSSWSDRVSPRVVPDRPFRVREVRRGETIQRIIRVDDLPPPETSVLLRIDHLPRPLAVQGIVAAIGALVLLAAFALAVISGRGSHA